VPSEVVQNCEKGEKALLNQSDFIYFAQRLESEIN